MSPSSHTVQTAVPDIFDVCLLTNLFAHVVLLLFCNLEGNVKVLQLKSIHTKRHSQQ